MSIIIKGVEMPTRCWDCLLNTYGYCMASDKHSDIIPSDAPIPDWCPLVPVPEHGDLIDRQAFRYEMDKHYPFDKATQSRHGIEDVLKSAVLRMLSDAPTIIPADREGEG